MKRTAWKGALVALGMAAGLAVGCEGPSKGKPEDPNEDSTSPKLAEVYLGRGLPERSSAGLFRPAAPTLMDFRATLREAKKDEDVGGFLVHLGGAPLGFAAAEEVVRIFGEIRAEKKPVYCHAHGYSNLSLWVASQACDQIWMSPAGSVDSEPLAAELMFLRGFFDRVGVKVNMLQVGKYKGTGEMFTRSTASKEMRNSLQGALSAVRNRWLDGLNKGRPKSKLPSVVEKGPFPAEVALKQKLIDKLGYANEARAALRKAGKLGRSSTVFGHGRGKATPGGSTIELIRILSGAKRGKKGGSDHIAVLPAEGGITMAGGGGMFGGGGGISASKLIPLIRRVRKDDAAKAVILRIDSPGGSALASDLLWHELYELRKKKPLIVSVGSMAASGGYYMACAGTKIVAEPSSIVGSIGVVGGKFAIAPALKPYGVNVETVPANPNQPSGQARIDSAMLPWDAASEKRVKATMTSIYDLFLQRVATGRHMPKQKVSSFAEGRIFGGIEAKSRGMVDVLGGMDAAIELARKEAHLDAEARVKVVAQEQNFLDQLAEGDDSAKATLRGEIAQRLLGVKLPSHLVAHGQSLLPLLTKERTLVALPMAINLR